MIIFLTWTPIILVLSGFGFVLVIGLILLFFEARKAKKVELNQIEGLVNWAEDNYPKLISRRDNYCASHPDYAKEPVYNELKEIYAICKIRYEGKSYKSLYYCYFDNIVDSGDKLTITYNEYLPMTAFKKAKTKTRTIEIDKSEYNKTWFLCDELAILKVIEILKDDYLINVDPLVLNDEKSASHKKREEIL